MAHRWLNLSIRIALSLGLLYSIYLVSTRAIAQWYFRQPSPDGVRKAIQFDPSNPQYYAALGRFSLRSFEEYDLRRAIRLYEKATRLRPSRARYWTELGSAYELAGRLGAARRAYEQGQRLFPRSPAIHWQRGNFYLRTRRIEEALSAFQKAVLGDPRLGRLAFDLAWRATGDADLILEKMIPPKTEIFFHYLHYLIEKQRLEEAEQVWARLLALGLRFEPMAALPYLDALIRHQRVDALTKVWAALAERHPAQVWPHRRDSNLITNGDFERPILNGGLDWRVSAIEGVVVSVDNSTFFDGTRSLSLRFDGQHNLDYRHLFQYVPVEPNTRYRFRGYVRTRGITTDRGPRFQIYDTYDSTRLFLSTENLVGTSSWSPQQLEFCTGPATRLLVIRIARPRSRKFDNQIAGTVWIDRLTLHHVE